jgi:hypothetical protein
VAILWVPLLGDGTDISPALWTDSTGPFRVALAAAPGAAFSYPLTIPRDMTTGKPLVRNALISVADADVGGVQTSMPSDADQSAYAVAVASEVEHGRMTQAQAEGLATAAEIALD